MWKIKAVQIFKSYPIRTNMVSQRKGSALCDIQKPYP